MSGSQSIDTGRVAFHGARRTRRSLKAMFIAVVFVSHKLAELFSVCERVVVLRNGHVVAEGPVDQFDAAKLTTHMTGREVHDDVLVFGHGIGQRLLQGVAVGHLGHGSVPRQDAVDAGADGFRFWLAGVEHVAEHRGERGL